MRYLMLILTLSFTSFYSSSALSNLGMEILTLFTGQSANFAVIKAVNKRIQQQKEIENQKLRDQAKELAEELSATKKLLLDTIHSMDKIKRSSKNANIETRLNLDRVLAEFEACISLANSKQITRSCYETYKSKYEEIASGWDQDWGSL